MARLCLQYLAHYNNELLPNSTKSCQRLIKFSPKWRNFAISGYTEHNIPKALAECDIYSAKIRFLLGCPIIWFPFNVRPSFFLTEFRSPEWLICADSRARWLADWMVNNATGTWANMIMRLALGHYKKVLLDFFKTFDKILTLIFNGGRRMMVTCTFVSGNYSLKSLSVIF